MGERDLRVISRFAERLERRAEIVLLDEQIDVLGLANDSGVAEQRMGPADEKRNPGVAQDVQRSPVEGVGIPGGFVEGGLIGHGGLKCKTMARNVQYESACHPLRP